MPNKDSRLITIKSFAYKLTREVEQNLLTRTVVSKATGITQVFLTRKNDVLNYNDEKHLKGNYEQPV